MTEPRRADLTYGQLGEVVYDIGNQEWRFARRPGIVRQILPVGESTVTIKPSTEISFPQSIHSAVERVRDIKELTGAYPELVPSISLLPHLTLASEAIIIATSTHDPAVSQLLVFGKAADLDNQRSGARTVSIAAIASGEAGEAVRLVRLSHDYLRWPGHRSIGLKTQTLAGGDQGWWIGRGSPIQQLCFAEAEGEPSTWLAIRYAGATTILRPLLRRLPVPATFLNGPGSSRKCFPSSRIDANPILSLPVGLTGGAPHADVSFNPYYQRQFAIVDQCGQWTIWNIEGQHRRRHLWHATAGPKGQIRAVSDDDAVKPGAPADATHDGWGAILWAASINTIVVADRRTLATFYVKARPQRLATPIPYGDMDGDSILDLKRSPLDDSQLFVVTSSRVLCLRIRRSDPIEDGKDIEIGAEILYSTRHFRDQEDTSLRLQLLSDDGYLIALLYSRLATLCTAFHIPASSSISDPSIIPLSVTAQDGTSQDMTTVNKLMRPSTLAFRPVRFENRGTSDPSGPGLGYVQRGASFYKLFGLYNDMSLSEGLYSTTSDFPALAIPPPEAEKRSDTKKSSAKVGNDDWIVADGLAVDDFHDDCLKLLPSMSRLSPAIGKTIQPRQEDQWTVNLEWLHEELERRLTIASTSESTKLHSVRSFEDCLEDLDGTIRDMSVKGQRGMESLSSLLDVEVLLSDVDRASTELQDFITSIRRVVADAEENDAIDKVPLSSRPVTLLTTETSYALFRPMDDGEERNLGDLSDAYNKLLHSWISPLASTVPGKVRIGIEKRLRKIVAQLCFASFGVRLEPRPGSWKQSDGQDAMDLAKVTLPVRGKGTAAGSSERGKGKSRETSTTPQPMPSVSRGGGLMSDSAQLEAPLPTPGPTPSLHSRNSISSQDGPDKPACERLRNLTRLTAQAPLPASMTKLLSHWTVGMDPANYDWDARRRVLATGSDTEGTGDEGQVKRRQGMERRLKRQRQDSIGTWSQPQAASMWGGQPEAARGTPSRSQIQVTEGSLFPVSEVEPGRYGSRQAIGAKATKRHKHGF